MENGAYGKRMGKICEVLQVSFHVESFPEDSKVDPAKVEEILRNDPSFTNICIVHCETSSGVINPVEEVGKVVKKFIPGKILRGHVWKFTEKVISGGELMDMGL